MTVRLLPPGRLETGASLHLIRPPPPPPPPPPTPPPTLPPSLSPPLSLSLSLSLCLSLSLSLPLSLLRVVTAFDRTRRFLAVYSMWFSSYNMSALCIFAQHVFKFDTELCVCVCACVCARARARLRMLVCLSV